MDIRTIIAATVAALILSACGSSKHVADNNIQLGNANANVNATAKTATSTTATANANSKAKTAAKAKAAEAQSPVITIDHFVSDLDLDLTMGEDSYSLGGKVSMKRDKVVRLNLTFMGFVEVGIIEFTPDNILIVNRIGKEYTRAPYNSLDVLKKNNITFQNIQLMAWEKLYSQDGKKITDSSLDQAIENMINSNMKDGRKATVHITVGKPNTERDFETVTTVKDSYKEVPAQVLMARLMSAMK